MNSDMELARGLAKRIADNIRGPVWDRMRAAEWLNPRSEGYIYNPSDDPIPKGIVVTYQTILVKMPHLMVRVIGDDRKLDASVLVQFKRTRRHWRRVIPLDVYNMELAHTLEVEAYNFAHHAIQGKPGDHYVHQ